MPILFQFTLILLFILSLFSLVFIAFATFIIETKIQGKIILQKQKRFYFLLFFFVLAASWPYAYLHNKPIMYDSNHILLKQMNQSIYQLFFSNHEMCYHDPISHSQWPKKKQIIGVFIWQCISLLCEINRINSKNEFFFQSISFRCICHILKKSELIS